MLEVEITYYLVIILYNWLLPIPSLQFLIFMQLNAFPGSMDGSAKVMLDLSLVVA